MPGEAVSSPVAAPAGASDPPAEPWASAGASVGAGDLSTMVRAAAAAVRGLPGPDAVDPDRTFRDLGFESRDAVELRLALQAATGRRLPSTVVFDHPTATALAAWLTADGLIPSSPAAAPKPWCRATVRTTGRWLRRSRSIHASYRIIYSI